MDKNVSIRSCNNYTYNEAKAAIQKVIYDLGGLEKYIKRNSKVFIKLNLLMKKKPEEVTTTHPMILKVLAQELLKLDCSITVGDSPGGTYSKNVLKGLYKVCGIEGVCSELGINLNFDTSEVKVENKDGKILKFMNVITPITEVDHVINVCKLKTHVMATFTGGVKNLFGVIPGVSKAEYHFKMPEVTDFTQALVDICRYVNPTLTIMDGVIGMEGEGPSAGTPKKVGVILGSNNPYALDAVACKIINLNPLDVPTIQRSIECKLLDNQLDDINIIGESIQDKIIYDYKIPKLRSTSFLRGIVPKKIELIINKRLAGKPKIIKNECVACGDCAKVCPPKVISMEKGKPEINLNYCIRCFCCHELCPKKAIEVKRPVIYKLLR